MENKEMTKTGFVEKVKNGFKKVGNGIKKAPWKKIGKAVGIGAGVLLGGAVVGKFVNKPDYEIPDTEVPFDEEDEDK